MTQDTKTFSDRVREQVGQEILVSDWFEVTQADIDTFADVTRDWDYMHNDPEWAATKGPWGTTIAHGMFLLSLVGKFHGDAGFPVLATADGYCVNYGYDRVRFTEPVRVGDRIRARLSVLAVDQKKPGRELIRTQVVVETERLGDQPHMIAEKLTLYVHGEATADAR
jgi:acyl dehydratase